ncbi:MAG: prephenate dehydratase [Ardenticatenaceae bacterium]|nr:prephenate dehydratase [Ardenticatenaceae bacterium]
MSDNLQSPISNPQSPPLRVAFQGEPGAYSEGAALAFFGAETATVPCESFDDVFAAVTGGHAGRAMIPIENSLAGSIHRNYDLLLRHDLHIIGELNFRVHHNLLALPGVALSDVRRVLSHPQALAQCEGFIDRLGVVREATYDTAGSAKMVRQQALLDAAAIASTHAAEVYGLAILAAGIEDDPENYTRFLALAGEPHPVPPGVPAKTSIVFALKNAPGVLFKALSVFALRDIDLTKIESRPMRGTRWEYVFYLDFAASLEDDASQNALRHLGEIATMLRVLGSYPRDA